MHHAVNKAFDGAPSVNVASASADAAHMPWSTGRKPKRSQSEPWTTRPSALPTLISDPTSARYSSVCHAWSKRVSAVRCEV
jgi:hypothetical protein